MTPYGHDDANWSVLPAAPPPRRPASWLRPTGLVLAGAVGALAVVGVLGGGLPGATTRLAADRTPTPVASEPAPPPAAEEQPAPPEPAPPPAEPPPPALLMPSSGGDGDSWKDTAGVEYRLGLVNSPESDQCFGAQATEERRRRVAAGFSADVYTTDRYGRQVAVVTTADGTNLNVHLARHGFADDRFLAQFRHENPPLAAELDRAFAQAKAEGAGLWGACREPAAAPAPPPAAAPQPLVPQQDAPAPSGCHPDYLGCVPVKGNGSGAGDANDLDCGQIRAKVQVRQPGVDPYRLDSDGDGWGCESYG